MSSKLIVLQPILTLMKTLLFPAENCPLQPLLDSSTHNLKHSITDLTFARAKDKFGSSFLSNLN